MKVEVRENASFEFFRFSDFCQRHSGLHRKLHDACAAGRLPHSCCTAGLLADESCPSQDLALKTNGQYNTHMSPYISNSVSRLITTGKCGENGNAKRQKVRKGSLVSSVPWTYTGALALQGNTRPKQSSLGSAALPKMCVHDSCVLSLPTRPRTVTGVAAVATKALSFRFVHAVAGRKRYASWRKAQRAASQAP